MSKEINIAKNISNLRKQRKVTQEQLAEAVKVSPQAVSKWETASCFPDTMTLPLIAEYFNVSIDYLFYGSEKNIDEITDDELCDILINRVAAEKIETVEPYNKALKFSLASQHGILIGHERDLEWKNRHLGTGSFCINETPLHLRDIHGLSVSTTQGYSTIIMADFINTINGKTMKKAKQIFEALANDDCLRVTVEIINFQGISSVELKEKTGFDDERLKKAVEVGKKAHYVEERKSVHRILGSEFYIQRHHYNCLCEILSAIKMIELSLKGATRLMIHGPLTISFDDNASSTQTRNSFSSEEN